MRSLRFAAPVLAAAALLSAVVGSYAWFDHLTNVRTEENLLRSASQSVSIEDYTIFMCDDLASPEDHKVYNAQDCTENGHNDEAFHLNSYDTLFGRNSETPVYFLIPVKGLAVESGASLSFTVHATDPVLSASDNTKLNQVMSNVTQVRGKAISAEQAAGATYRGLYDLMHSGEALPKGTFANFTVNEDTGVIETAGVRSDAVVTLSGYGAGSVCYALLELDYDHELLLDLLANYAGGDTVHRLGSADDLHILHDITSITVTAG